MFVFCETPKHDAAKYVGLSSSHNYVYIYIYRFFCICDAEKNAILCVFSFSILKVVVVSASDVVPTEAPGATADCDPYCVLEVLPEGSRAKDGAAENTKYKTVCKVRMLVFFMEAFFSRKQSAQHILLESCLKTPVSRTSGRQQPLLPPKVGVFIITRETV